MDGPLPGKQRRWRWAAASAIGSSHLQSGLPCQDAYAVRRLPNDGLFACVADGAGSASNSRQGAWLLCRQLIGTSQAWFKENRSVPDDEEIWSWIDAFRDQVSLLAEKRELRTRQFACTLAGLICSKDEIVALQVGDSAAVARKEGEWTSLIWPENGEYASSTFFVTDDPEPRFQISRVPAEFDAFAIFSDGIGDIALEQIEKRPYARFFDPMMAPVDNNEKFGKLASLSNSLKSYLQSPAICERTDDDKTLILISTA